jgi:hypothetical protein
MEFSGLNINFCYQKLIFIPENSMIITTPPHLQSALRVGSSEKPISLSPRTYSINEAPTAAAAP